MVVFCKEDSGRQPHRIALDNERGNETSSPSPPKWSFFNDLDVSFCPRLRGPFNLVGLFLNQKIRQIGQISLDFQQDCLQLLHLLVDGEQERWINRVSDRVRDLHYQPESHLFHIPLSDREDDQHSVQTAWAIISLGTSVSRDNKYNQCAEEDNKDPDRVSVHLNKNLHMHLHNQTSSPNMLYFLLDLESLRFSLWPVTIQMKNQKLCNHRTT